MYLCGRNACNNVSTDGFGGFGSIRLAPCVVEGIQNAERSAGAAAEERRALHRSDRANKSVATRRRCVWPLYYAALQQRLRWFVEYNCHQRPKQPLRNCWSRRVSIEELDREAGPQGCPRSRSDPWTDVGAGARRHGRDTSAASADPAGACVARGADRQRPQQTGDRCWRNSHRRRRDGASIAADRTCFGRRGGAGR